MDPAGDFKSRRAPCGKTADGKRHQDGDEEVMAAEQELRLGCVITRHEYHDGSLSRKVVHRNGKILADELLAAE